MWKKLDQSPGIPFDSASNPTPEVSDESLGRMLMAEVSGSTNADEQLASVPKPALAQGLQQLSTTTLREYAESVEKCTKSAREYLRCASLLSEARESYDKLRGLSEEIRKLLDMDEVKLRALMDQVHETATFDSRRISGQFVSQRRGPESFKAEDVTSRGEKPRLTKFP
ncbi:MAG: hypothetical protein ACM3WP_19805 [Acidobacteriota bacterium]